MVLVGSEEFQHLNDGFTELIKSGRDGTVMGNERTDMRKLMAFEATEAVIEDINIRLLENNSAERRVAFSSIDVGIAAFSWSAGPRVGSSPAITCTHTSTWPARSPARPRRVEWAG